MQHDTHTKRIPFTLPPLPFSPEDLEPFSDRETVEIHHGKHHAAYVANLNKALAVHPEMEDQTVEELLADLHFVPEDIRSAVINNGGGHANHSLFWRIMGPKRESSPDEHLSAAINITFGDVSKFKKRFTETAAKHFGSGWTWLSVGPLGDLLVENTSNQESPLSRQEKPILALDLWEHAYYLKFQNRRDEWIEAWWNLVNWDEVSRLYARIMEGAGLRDIYGAELSLAQTGGRDNGVHPR